MENKSVSNNDNNSNTSSTTVTTTNIVATSNETTDVNDVFNHGKSEWSRIDGPVRLYYISPMKAPAYDVKELESESKDEKELSNKLAQRFIASIIRKEKHIFHHYLGTIKIDYNNKGEQSKWTPIMFAIQRKRDYFLKHLLYSHSLFVVSQNGTIDIDISTEDASADTAATAESKDESNNENKNETTETTDDNNNLELLTNEQLEERNALLKYYKSMGIQSLNPFAVDLQCKDVVSRRSVIHLLCERGDCGILERILHDCNNGSIITDKPVLIDACDKKGQTGLYIACNKGFEDIVTVLLKYNANPNIATVKDGAFPLLQASSKGHSKVVAALLDHNKNIIEKMNKNNSGDGDNLNYLCNINQKDSRGRNALMVACAEDRKEIVTMLLGYGSDSNDERYERVDLNVTDSMNFGWNVLMWSIYRKNTEIAQMLLNSNLPIDFLHKAGENKVLILDFCNRCKADEQLKLEIWLAMMKRVFRPAIENAPIIKKLDIPQVIIDILCKMVY